MVDIELNFQKIIDTHLLQDENITLEKMMSSPALKYKNKVFAFCDKKSMGFRLGPEFDPGESKLKTITPLSPFKTKPPLKGWYIVSVKEDTEWRTLTRKALAFTKSISE